MSEEELDDFDDLAAAGITRFDKMRTDGEIKLGKGEGVSPIPSVRDELERKLLDTIKDLVERRQNAMVSPEVFSNCVDVLIDTVSGLVSRNTMEIISELETLARNDRPNVPESIRRHYLSKSGQIVVFNWKIGYGHFQIQIWEGQAMTSVKNVKCADAARAYQMLLDSCETAKSKGWVLI